MGLDMYLQMDVYLSTMDKEGSHLVKSMNDLLGLPTEYNNRGDIEHNSLRATSVTIEVGYWRKVNWIHEWFVRELNDGNDDQRRSHVPEEKLSELREIINEIKGVIKEQELFTGESRTEQGLFGSYQVQEIRHEANLQPIREIINEKLPVSSGGFFFGTYDEDIKEDSEFAQFMDWYAQSLDETLGFLDKIDEIKKQETFKWGEVYYQPSW